MIDKLDSQEKTLHLVQKSTDNNVLLSFQEHPASLKFQELYEEKNSKTNFKIQSKPKSSGHLQYSYYGCI